jgi:phage shock protein PspC (stress-responsive transcriptional regulator)
MTSISSDTPHMQMADDLQKSNENIKNVKPFSSNDMTSNTNIDKSSPQEIINDDDDDTNQKIKQSKKYSFIRTLLGEKKLRHKGESLRNKIGKFYDSYNDDNENKIHSINADLLNKSRLINMNNEAYTEKQQTSDILFSTLIAFLFLGIIGGVGNLIGIGANTLRIIYLIIIIVYLLNIIWIVKYSKPQWNPYLIKGNDGKHRKKSRKHKKCTSKKIIKYKDCEQRSCQYYGCKPKKE